MNGIIDKKKPSNSNIYQENGYGNESTIWTSDPTIQLAFVGDIYNAEIIKQRLVQKEYHFETDRVEEVIVKSYIEFGMDCLTTLQGTFSFVLLDFGTNECIVVRDRLGKRPLYYFNDRDSFIVSTSLKNVMRVHPNKMSIHYEAVEYFLRFYYIPQPLTIFQDVFQLLPGYYAVLSLEKGTFEQKKYWDIHPENNVANDSYSSLQERLRNIVTSSVEKRIAGEKKIGAFLSGGIDSSIVVGELVQQSEQPIHTFTIGYKEHPLYDESGLAKLVAERHRTNHYELFIDFKDVEEVIEEIINNMDEPFADSSAIPTFYVSRLAKNYVDIAFSGDGGDELFAGYNKYTSIYYQKLYTILPSLLRKRLIEPILCNIPSDHRNTITSLATKAKKFIEKADENPFQMHVNFMEAYEKDQIALLVKNKVTSMIDIDEQLFHYYHFLEHADAIHQMMYTDLKFTLPNDMLVKINRMSSMHNLETKLPLLDEQIIEYAYTIPTNYKIRGTKRKIILKEAFQHLLPKEIITAKKRGFSIPLAEWFKNELKEMVYCTLSKEKIENANLVNFNIVERIIEEHMTNRINHANLIWSLLVLHKWHEHFRKSLAEVEN